MRFTEPVIPDSLTPEKMPGLLRHWHLGSRARRYLSRRRFAAVTELLGVGNGGRALDVGCGWGYNLYLLHSKGFGPFGIDIVQNDFPAAAAIALANGYSANLVGTDVSALPFPSDTFAAVTAVETFEHIYQADREGAVREIARVLVPGGSLALSTPNYASLVEGGKRLLVRIPYLKRFFPSMCYPAGEVKRADYHPYQYHRPLPAAEIERLLRDAGFEVRAKRMILFVWKNTPDLLFPICRFFESVLERTPFLRNLASTVVIRAVRKA